MKTSKRGWIYVGLMFAGLVVWVVQYGEHYSVWAGWLIGNGVGDLLAKNLIFAVFLLGIGLVLEVAVRLAWLGTGKLRGDPALKRWLVVLIAIACGVTWMTLIPMASRQLPDAAASAALYMVVLYGGLISIVWSAVRVGRFIGVFPPTAGKQNVV
jgi:hypothetical protein